MSAGNTALTMAAAAGTAALLEPTNTLIADTISVGAGIAKSITENTGEAVNYLLGTGGGIAATTGLAAVYGGVKVGEFIDEKIFKFENKYLKNASKIGGGLVGLGYAPIAAPIGLGVAAWKGGKWAVKGLGSGIKSLWNKGYSNNSPAA
ncbi:MAG: hypothetical protein Q9M94_06875 [Candidatus Gracilibacteria bacterium]|nr:hypothetical protein [Candidatus Gracilibacteria bacterium]MDQ7022917.1 hypothetical protein [Candidatus Gracilibacteria bacterium]